MDRGKGDGGIRCGEDGEERVGVERMEMEMRV
jgi:hypothetical protein